jgi:NitT/TauT family transport system substrate-binding protein
MEEAVVRQALRGVTYTETPSVAGEEEYVNFLRRLGFITLEDAAAFTRRFIAEEFRRTAGEQP